MTRYVYSEFCRWAKVYPIPWVSILEILEKINPCWMDYFLFIKERTGFHIVVISWSKTGNDGFRKNHSTDLEVVYLEDYGKTVIWVNSKTVKRVREVNEYELLECFRKHVFSGTPNGLISGLEKQKVSNAVSKTDEVLERYNACLEFVVKPKSITWTATLFYLVAVCAKKGSN